jgi:hypothetical protein
MDNHQCKDPIFDYSQISQKAAFVVAGISDAIGACTTPLGYVLSGRAAWTHLVDKGELQVLVEATSACSISTA